MPEIIIEILRQFGLVGLGIVILSAGFFSLWRENKNLVSQLQKEAEQRFKDILQLSREYGELSEEIHKSLDILIRMLKKNGT